MKNLATVGAVSAALLSTMLAPAGASTAWVPTISQGMPLAKNVSVIGALAPSKTLRIAVGLQMNRAAALAYLNHVVTPGDSLYNAFLTPAQFAAAFAPSTAAAQSVASYLTSAGLTNVTVTPNRLMVTATGTVAAISSAFNTKMYDYSVNGTPFFANATVAEVPATLGTTVLSVNGIDSLATMHENLRFPNYANVPANLKPHVAAGVNTNSAGPGDTSSCTTVPPQGLFVNPAFFTQFGLPVPPVTGTTFPTPPAGVPINANECLLASLGPLGFQRLYDAAGASDARSEYVAILAEGKVYPQVVPNDLRTFEARNHVPQVPFQVIPTAPVSTLTDVAGQDEFDMDTQYASGMANKVYDLLVFDGPSLSDADLANEINAWVVDNRAKTASLSVGGCEFIEAALGGTALIDQTLIEAVVQGQSLFVSSGDEGSACALVANTGTPAGVQSVEYPASSTYAVAVGGTSSIPTDTDSYNYEVSWVGGGGGISYVEPAPIWQYNNNVPSALASHRGVPDIAMPADPNFGGAVVVVNGVDTVVGGTSLAAPLSNGIWGRMLQSRYYHTLGFAAPVLYNVYAKNYSPTTEIPVPGQTSELLGGFHDVYTGSNGAYQALPGYDYNTGVGSLDILALQKALAK